MQSSAAVSSVVPPSQFVNYGDVGLTAGQTPYHHSNRVSYISRKTSCIGTLILILGILAIIFNIVGLALDSETYRLFFVGHGLWIGIFYIITGSFGVAASKHQNKCLSIAFLVLAIIASVMSLVMLILGIIGAAIEPCSENYGYDCSYYSCYRYVPPCTSRERTLVAMEALLAIIGLTAGILTIIGSAFGCKACCCHTNATQPTSVVYGQYAGQPVIIYTSQQPPQQMMMQNNMQPYTIMPPNSAVGPVAPPAYTMNQWPGTTSGNIPVHPINQHQQSHQQSATHQFNYAPAGAPPPEYNGNSTDDRKDLL